MKQFFILCAGLLLLSGCYEDPQQLVLHEQGVYQGKQDDRHVDVEQLAKRFAQVQTDR